MRQFSVVKLKQKQKSGGFSVFKFQQNAVDFQQFSKMRWGFSSLEKCGGFSVVQQNAVGFQQFRKMRWVFSSLAKCGGFSAFQQNAVVFSILEKCGGLSVDQQKAVGFQNDVNFSHRKIKNWCFTVIIKICPWKRSLFLNLGALGKY